MTNSASGVRLGGGGYSYGDYSLPTSKKPAPYDEDQAKSGRKASGIDGNRLLSDDEAEVFLFTIKDPIRTVISKLMDLISIHGSELIPPIDIKLAETGPLGYTTMFAFQPTGNYRKVDSLIKPVVK